MSDGRKSKYVTRTLGMMGTWRDLRREGQTDTERQEVKGNMRTWEGIMERVQEKCACMSFYRRWARTSHPPHTLIHPPTAWWDPSCHRDIPVLLRRSLSRDIAAPSNLYVKRKKDVRVDRNVTNASLANMREMTLVLDTCDLYSMHPSI